MASNYSTNSKYLSWLANLPEDEQVQVKALPQKFRHNLYLGACLPVWERDLIEKDFTDAGSRLRALPEPGLEVHQKKKVLSAIPEEVNVPGRSDAVPLQESSLDVKEVDPAKTTQAKRSKMHLYNLRVCKERASYWADICDGKGKGHIFDPKDEGFCPSQLFLVQHILSEFMFATQKVEPKVTLMKRYEIGDGRVPAISTEQTLPGCKAVLEQICAGLRAVN